MRRRGSPMLFAPPQPPMWVPRSRPVVIGRVAECDLTVNTRKVSRRHAEVRYEGEQVIIEDLGSTNGTYVNGEPVRGIRVLKPGDRIHIGGLTITFCHVDSQLAAVGDVGDDEAAQTVIFEDSPLDTSPEEAFRGDLSQVPASAVLQVLCMSNKTGVLGMVTAESAARIWLDNGVPVHAETPGKEGIDAAIEIAQITEGRFLFEGGRTAPKHTLCVSVAELLLEAHRRLDEGLFFLPSAGEPQEA